MARAGITAFSRNTSETSTTIASLDKKEINGSFPPYPMKQGRKKIEKEEAVSRKPEPEEAGIKKAESADSGAFTVTSEMIGGNPHGIDGVRALQAIAIVMAVVELIWLINRYFLHIF